ncbi:glycosyltransferase family 2 protein [Arenicella xantha]|uniref:Glycosyl transferase family 2 n=1 Tax=Arenicella xantha TaxID=644221 RepID=A0A395JI51_9GAMM|nr:glycosyltransferase family A protein [Arenicella xantha]RBP48276.1 glycosyl transferase family 2 [Arenicella xantha]
MNLSILIPTYNRQALLVRALESVFAQDWLVEREDYEVIVIDDGSTDGTADMIAVQFPQVRYIYQTNRGVSSARNTGLGVAEGDWIALLDSDDNWLPEKLSLQFSALEQTKLQVCHGEEIWIRNGVRVNQMDKHQKHGGWIFEYCLPLCAMSPSSIVIHRSVFDRVGVFDPDLPACEDYDLWLRIAALYEVAFVSTPCINKYGGHTDQLSRQFWGMDRFRVIALENCLGHSEIQANLSSELTYMARQTLLKKLEILLNGAIKRDNLELIEYCETKLAHWR